MFFHSNLEAVSGLTGLGEESEEGEQLREPLIMGLASDDEGSVGSVDSSDQEEEDGHMPPPISRKTPPPLRKLQVKNQSCYQSLVKTSFWPCQC